MKAVSRAVGDALLGLFAVAVVAGSVVVIQQSNDPSSASLLADGATPAGSTQPAPGVTPSRTAGRATLVVAGPDLAKLRDALASESAADVTVVKSTASDLIAAGALDDITASPAAVVLEIVAGTKTSVRTAAAVNAAHKRWPQTEIFVVGPFSSADRKSAAAAKAAALAAHATFLDPVELKWRVVSTSPSLSAADEAVVAGKLADVLL
ncbi:MAG: hypothetical protein JWM40_728 [Frankiales bacterium]|nr:hypothetical protein [Frankiales bacterium]